MRIRFFVHATCLGLSLFWLTATASAQPAPNPTETPTPVPSLVYTGNLFGYFRTPSHQSIKSVGTCPTTDPSPQNSDAANIFLAVRNNQISALTRKEQDAIPQEYRGEYSKQLQEAVLLGTGDNFAPRLEARQFEIEPDPNSDKYVVRNKEPYFWDGTKWLLELDATKPDQKKVQQTVEAGQGTIPTDNVACFLAAARFAALVPGKHDFYYGPERLRELARLLARTTSGSPAPQMLAANLVIKTKRIDAAPFVRPENQRWPDDLAVNGLESVYPWLSSLVKIAIQPKQEDVAKELKKWVHDHQPVDNNQLRAYLQGKAGSNSDQQQAWKELNEAVTRLDSIYVCAADEAGNVSAAACESRGRQLEPQPISGENDQVVYAFKTVKQITAGEKGFPPNFAPGENGLCMHTAGNGKDPERCLQFSVFAPFFSFPDAGSKGPGYKNPNPFALVPKTASRPYDVAIFGVVDPTIGEHIGVLNFSWLNVHDNKDVNQDTETLVSAEDPVKALNQQLKYFEGWYSATQGQEFSGMKVLLAQMSPQRARVLAASLPQFQFVVTDADNQQATTQADMSTTWSAVVSASAFVAVPAPYAYDQNKQKKPNPGDPLKLEGQVQFGAIQASPIENRKWMLKAIPKPPIDVKVPIADAGDEFKKLIGAGISKCLNGRSVPEATDSPFDQVKSLTLCAMREELGADVALLQNRDLWDELPPDSGKEPDHTKQTVQQSLDRIIWKGDLLTLLYVPGRALKSVLKLSDAFAREDANPLSLADEKSRKLEFLGITKSGNDYLINEVPISDTRIYAVAASDYIVAGDTGYPALAAAALDPKNRANQFSSPMETISSVVCRKLFDNESDARRFCLASNPRNDALDRSTASAAPSGKKPSFWSQLWKDQPFKWPKANDKPKSIKQGVELEAQQHPIWTFSLKNFSVGFDGLTKNLTDDEVSRKFTGVPVADITTSKNSSVTAQLDTRFSRTTHAHEFFVNLTTDFKQRSTGDTAPQILQMKNRGTTDVGIIRNLRGGRSQTRVGVALYTHFETPLQKPFSTFSLGGKDRLRIAQDRNLLVLPRVGLRWQNGTNSFEGGLQAGREINAFGGYTFNTNGVTVSCKPNLAETFAACVNRLIKAGTVTKNSVASAILENRARAGLYSRLNLTIPFTDKVRYVLSEEGDFFFNFHGDNSIDTRLRDISKHSLKFTIWPSFSIGPSLQILLYRNKVNGEFLFQRQFGFETTLSFDLFNHREKMVQIKYKKP